MPKDISKLRVAIVHDWLVGGGAERVVFELHKMFPEAPIYTSYCTDEWRAKLEGKVVTGFLQHWPFSRLRKFLPVLRIWWFSRLDLSGYDLVISSSGNGEAKGIKVQDDTTHICYCHAPTHFYWRHYDQYMKRPGFGIFNPLARIGLRLLVGPLRRWDLKASKRPHAFIANSTHTKNDIKKYYNRDSVIVYPPVDVERFATAKANQRQGFVTMGRLATYKHTAVIVEACTRLNLPLKVIGRGPDLAYLKKIAGPSVTFLTSITDEEMPEQLAGAEAFLFAAYEDFGVAPIEAMAAGTPVIAYKDGGALDYVVEGKSGMFFEEQTAESLVAALQKFNSNDYTTHDIKTVAQEFSVENFHKNLQATINSVIQ